MNTKRFWMAFVAAYVVNQVLGFLIHGIWLDPVYQGMQDVFRPQEQMQPMMGILMFTAAVATLMFCFVFTRGYENRGIGEGVRYGLYMGIFLSIVTSIDPHVIYPVPLDLTIKWFISSVVTFVVMGVVVALIYKPPEGDVAAA